MSKFEAALRKVLYAIGEVDDGTIFEAADSAINSIESLQDTVLIHDSQIEQLQQRVNSLEDTLHAESKQAKVKAIVHYAENRRHDGQEAVVLDTKEIKGATGVTRRYAYDIIDEWSAQYPFLEDRDELQQYGQLEIDTDARDRGIAVVFDRVPQDGGSLNKFNNENAEEGGEA